ncbi:MAG: restriction endonuclease [Parasphingorhabdus sp.]
MIPDYQALMRPVLEYSADGEVSISEAVNVLASRFELSEEDLKELLPSQKQSRFVNRVNWAKSYLKQAGLVQITGRGLFKITDRGREVLENHRGSIDNRFLKQFDDFVEFQNRGNDKIEAVTSDDESNTPDESLREAFKKINSNFALDLIDRVRSGTPEFFEHLIVQLLIAMGYGGTSDGAGRAIGKSGDDGVDGVIDQDPLGVDQIYIQAKKYKEGSNIGSGDIRDFYGALSLKKANKGIFVTASKFSSKAIETSRNFDKNIVLIDGRKLADLMILYNIGCQDEDVLRIKKFDEDFFE